MKNVPLGGWYQTWLNNGDVAVAGLLPAVPAGSAVLYSLDSDGLDMHGVSLAGHMEYRHGDLFSISAEGSVQPQDGKKGYFNGYDRPKITALFKASVRPLKPLRISASYDFRGKRAIYTRAMRQPQTGGVDIDGRSTSSRRGAPFATDAGNSGHRRFQLHILRTKSFSPSLNSYGAPP